MTKILIYHTEYGCDTGCCGHALAVVDDNFKGDWFDAYLESAPARHFAFDHPWLRSEMTKEERHHAAYAWAIGFIREQLGEEHVKDLDFENSVILDD